MLKGITELGPLGVDPAPLKSVEAMLRDQAVCVLSIERPDVYVQIQFTCSNQPFGLHLPF